ncbi:UDP-N-acetylmuramoyl-L-alanyl-D-glutamate--L-lysine ligase [Jeotgalicoccus aerolatus]|uniref:UDP-N-acetylmuramoyl-L-alanyl-D-glutamate--2, 6-diaminopimelate ligase n=1 Tax=Jeotgalicoccus aerolatus TaxID=709510 RepID=UPI001640F3FC|nr:UDP-N-acetylmuramoyl-L-alanyl-D-glutamate--2,6-diaminopimelate ligase [Jeotgalicoccus aerolatus]GGD98594.1 UDP-N-acetylmuramoyl-L-alanyl-D-glutamate--L-lysine ligase [Jeotgalicoccus aerolatus]CAD2077257.1 UDP-N-acetylmuramoyl-L-alanyl-D-glutamate--L-lysine ligase [Jeotgalicoccus aerolatus]HJG33449.1 UDP-N-acetylmuramoyl-L-alanyl-D-glutamate--2,6-diaminopimelate ligase [Jeotgalicoccus aerolatus]
MKSTMLLSLLKIKTTYGNFPETVKDITSDSRETHEDSVFVAIKGHQTDGLYFADDVIQRGCRFIVADRYIDLPDHVGLLVVKDPGKTAALFAEYIYDFPHESQTMIGVTGTNGKTTVSTMIHNLSMALGKKSAYLGTNGFMINEDHIVSANTTPETTRLHKRLREAHENDTEVFTMEVSSHGLKLGRTFGVNFDIAIFTNLTQDHLDFHNSMDEYGHIKGLLFSQLGQDVKKHKYVVLNNDDKWSEVYKDMTPFETISYGMDSTADFYPTEIEGSLEGFNFTLNTPEGRFKVNSPFVGEYNIQNLMCAIISEWLQGYEFERILEAVPAMKPVDGRLEVLDPSLPVNIIIDFAHTPDALRKVINTVQPFVSGKLTCLIGMTGERDYSKGAEMGEIATLADYAIFTPDNPANDDPAMLVKLLEEGAVHDNFTSFTDREEGIIHAVNNAEPGDTIILACKGREPYQIVEDYVKMPHRDDLIALDAAYRKYRSEEYVDGSSKI